MSAYTRQSREVHRALLLILALVLLLSIAPLASRSARAAEPDVASAERAIEWLRGQQRADGSFAAFGGEGDPSSTSDAVLAFVAAGVDPSEVVSSGGISATGYLLAQASAVVGDPVRAKVVLALASAGLNPYDANSTDLIASLSADLDATTGRYGDDFYDHVIAVLALNAAGAPIPQPASDALLAAQIEDGSWGFTGDTLPGTGDSNTTAITIQALAALGLGGSEIDAGLAYLMELQDANGAVAYDAASLETYGGDANSTAIAVQAFVAAGDDPSLATGGDLLAALLTFQNESGAFQFQPSFPDDSLLATVQAIPAVLLKPFPLDPIPAGNPLVEALEPVTPLTECDYHEPTQHNLCGTFRDYWTRYGGLANFGYALTDEFQYDGYRVQYFERARFEWHPENAGTEYEVLLTLVGTQEAEREYGDEMAPSDPLADCAYFDVTRHNVCGNFVDFWNEFGGLFVFGYPVTEPFEENGLTVQYFERGRLEYQPGVWPERLDVLLGRLAAEQIDRELGR